MKDFLMDLAIVVVVLVIALPFAIKSCEPNEVVKCDTIYVHDTIRIVEPIHVKEEVVRYEKVYLRATDTIVKIDSIEVIVPITQKTYEDSTYKAVVRGYNPELVSLDIYNSTKYYPVVEKVKVKPKIVVSAGVYGGFGVKGSDYGLGIMVGVPIWSW
jgi:hypothetical protein